MSKRSRNDFLSHEANVSRTPPIEQEGDVSEAHSPPTKYGEIDSDATATHPTTGVQCTLAPHREIACFDAQEDYEIHYAKEHVNRCAMCSKNFPTVRFLELHLEENHSALQEAMVARGEKTYGCFVEDCDRKCSTPQKRRLHVIDKHMFPQTYNFRVVDQGIDDRSSMLREGRKRRFSTARDNHRADRYRRQASSQLLDQRTNASEGTSDRRSPNDDNEKRAAKLEPHKAEDPNRATVPDETSKGGRADLDSLTWSLSTLRFTPTSVLRKWKDRSNHLDGPVPEGKIQCSHSPQAPFQPFQE